MCHHDREADIHLMDNVTAVCQDVMDNKADDMPYEFMGHTSYIAKSCRREVCPFRRGFGNIIYSKTRFMKNRKGKV